MMVSKRLNDLKGVRHGFFTRLGGVSDGLYSSLNCGFGSGDKPENVSENRAYVAEKLGVDTNRLLTVRQTHGNIAVIADSLWGRNEAPEADAIATSTPGVAIGILTADCTPILLADEQAGVIGAAHAGWRGARAGIIAALIGAMETLGADRKRLCAAIGPAISRKAYEVGSEFEATFLGENDENRRFFARADASDRPHFDLPGYCLKRLETAGVGICDPLGLCTYENESLFFSYRRSVHRGEGDYGRQISAIVLG